MSHAIAPGDVLATLRQLPDNSAHGLLCDPPYGFSFMGKAWDYDVPSVEVWREALRVLRPGAALLSFGGARTFHRVACNIEDAGFELRDCLTWLYAKGFPKSMNVSKALDASTSELFCTPTRSTVLGRQWDGYGTALKPAWEPILLARKPLAGTVTYNVATYGCGALNIDGCRLERDPDDVSGFSKTGSPASDNVAMSGGNTARAPRADAEGRWPANLCLDEEAGALLDATAGDRPSRPSVTRNGGGNAGGDVFVGRTGSAKPDSGRHEIGGPSRFFLQVKSCAGDSSHESVNIAKSFTDLANLLNDFALTSAAQLPHLAELLSTFEERNSRALNTAATESKYALNVESNTEQILNTARRCSHALLRTRQSILNLVSSADPSTQIATTKITTSLLTFTSSVVNAISACTSQSSELGVEDSPSRFHFSSKVSTRERELGCEGLPQRSAGEVTDRNDGSDGLNSPRAGAGRTGGARNHHPTLKPIALTTWLARLILPPTPGATLLVPYAGAGSEMIGALLAGWPTVFGIEAEADYVAIAEARIAAHVHGRKAA